MAIFHSSSQVIGRSKGKSSVASSAYRSGEKIIDERTGLIHDFRRKKGVVYSNILVPQNAPEWTKKREILWNEVEKIEKRKDSQLAREINLALPIELNREEQIKLLEKYTKENFVDNGMIADIAIHDIEDGNPHAHIMLTMRNITENGFGNKNREWNDRKNIELWRENLALTINKALEEKGIKDRVDHRSYKEQGIEKLPTKHEGYVVRAMEKRGIKTNRGNENRKILEKNKMLQVINENFEILIELRGDYNESKFRGVTKTERRVNDGVGEEERSRGVEKTKGRSEENKRRSVYERGISDRTRKDDEKYKKNGIEYFERLKKDRELAERRERELRELEEERIRREKEEYRRFEESLRRNRENEREFEM